MATVALALYPAPGAQLDGGGVAVAGGPAVAVGRGVVVAVSAGAVGVAVARHQVGVRSDPRQKYCE